MSKVTIDEVREVDEAQEVQEDTVEEVEALPKPKPRRRRKKPAVKDVDMVTRRKYRLELFEEGDNKVFARQRGLSREGWKWPIIHGFQRRAPSGLVADSFLILVASRDLEVPAEEE